jgi:hypothetical protein
MRWIIEDCKPPKGYTANGTHWLKCVDSPCESGGDTIIGIDKVNKQVHVLFDDVMTRYRLPRNSHPHDFVFALTIVTAWDIDEVLPEVFK